VFLAKAEYFTGRGLKGLLSKAFFSGVGGIPMDRAGGEASERALRTGLRMLAAGELLGIYPEGTRTPDGRLYRGKTGVARLALESRSPVIPTAMIGGFEFQPPGKITPQLRIRPGVRFGPPLDFSRYYGMEHDHVVLRAMTDEIMYELMKLSGQEYVDEYAQRRKAPPSRRDKRRPVASDPAASDPAASEPAAPEPAAAEPGARPAVSEATVPVNGGPRRNGVPPAPLPGANGTSSAGKASPPASRVSPPDQPRPHG